MERFLTLLKTDFETPDFTGEFRTVFRSGCCAICRYIVNETSRALLTPQKITEMLHLPPAAATEREHGVTNVTGYLPDTW